MDYAKEIEYKKYCLSRNRADALIKELREMYGPDKTDSQIISIAYIKDKVISEAEYNLLKSYY